MNTNLNPPPQYRDPSQVRADQANPGDLILIDGKDVLIQTVAQVRTVKGETCVINWTHGESTGGLVLTPNESITTRHRIPEPAKYEILRQVRNGRYDKVNEEGFFEDLDKALNATWIPQGFRNNLILRARLATNGHLLDHALAYVDLVELFTEGFRAVHRAEDDLRQR